MKLTPRQMYFLWTLSDEPASWSHSDACEQRTAKSLVARGLVETMPTKLEPGESFEARFVQKGLVRADIFATLSGYTPPSHEEVYGKLRWRTS